MQRLKLAKIIYLVTSGAIAVLGIVLAVTDAIPAEVACRVVGGILCVAGLAKVFGYFSGDCFNIAFQFDLALGSITAILGACMLIWSGFSAGFYLVVICLLIAGNAIFTIQNAVESKKFGISKWWALLTGGIVALGMGFFSLICIYRQLDSGHVWIGLSMVLDGVQNIIVALITIRIKKRTGGSAAESRQDRGRHPEE